MKKYMPQNIFLGQSKTIITTKKNYMDNILLSNKYFKKNKNFKQNYI